MVYNIRGVEDTCIEVYASQLRLVLSVDEWRIDGVGLRD